MRDVDKTPSEWMGAHAIWRVWVDVSRRRWGCWIWQMIRATVQVMLFRLKRPHFVACASSVVRTEVDAVSP